MSVVQVSRHCVNCGHKTLHVKHQMSVGMCFVLSLMTGGIFFFFVWLPYRMLWLPFRPFRCQTCGKGRLT